MQQNKQKAGAMNAARQETSKEANGEHRGEVEEEIWVEKYRPLSLRHVVGQQTPASPANKLLAWLRDWARNNRLGAAAGGAEKKKAKPAPFTAQQDGSSFKAALISGPPGIGKTTCAVLCCLELGLERVEMNASDARNKAALDRHSSQLIDNQMEKYLTPPNGGDQKKKVAESGKVDHVLIMDEVDGMSGNADRAGISELIAMIKRSRIPIICICNDRQSQKIRSLAGHCFDLRFQRPRAEQIKATLKTICLREKVRVSDETLAKVIEASGQDVRQCVNALQMLAGSEAKRFAKKDISFNIFDVARQLLSVGTSLAQKQELFFADYSIMPLFVQENYPCVRNVKIGNAQHCRAMRQAAECIALGDRVSRCVRSDGRWNLLVDQAMLSAAIPATLMDGHGGQVQFPAWLGRYSTAQKRQRMARQLAVHTHYRTSGTSTALVTDYLGLLREKMYRPLVELENEGIPAVLDLYNAYGLVREDADVVNELAVWPQSAGTGGKASSSKKDATVADLAVLVSTKTKGAFTRALNKCTTRHLHFAHSAAAAGGGRKRKAVEAPVEKSSDDEDNDGVGDEEPMDLDDPLVSDCGDL